MFKLVSISVKNIQLFRIEVHNIMDMNDSDLPLKTTVVPPKKWRKLTLAQSTSIDQAKDFYTDSKMCHFLYIFSAGPGTSTHSSVLINRQKTF